MIRNSSFRSWENLPVFIIDFTKKQGWIKINYAMISKGEQSTNSSINTTAVFTQQEESITDSSSPFLISSLETIIPSLLELIKIDALEIYLFEKTKQKLECIFQSGVLIKIWERPEVVRTKGLLFSQFAKSELRVINLPNQRIIDINPDLRSKAFGQVICVPIISKSLPLGMACLVHTRRNLINAKEMAFIQAIIIWLAELIDFEKKIQQTRLQIVTEERERIGMDLHDGIIQSLYGIGLSLENARMNVSQGKDNGVKQIENALEALQSAIADIRAYILNLRPRQLRHSDLVEGMRSLIREFRANTMVEVEFVCSPTEMQGLARSQIDALYHIFQEALSNSAKHAKATRVIVRLWRRGERVMLKVNDNGMGFETSRSTGRIGHGLTNMQVRAEAAGGGMEVISIRKQGTNLLAWVPYIKESYEENEITINSAG